MQALIIHKWAPFTTCGLLTWVHKNKETYSHLILIHQESAHSQPMTGCGHVPGSMFIQPLDYST